MSLNRNALSYWFPLIEAAGLPVPRTIIVDMPDEAMEAMWGWFDGKDAGDSKPFFSALATAADMLGYPCFLRTDHTSAKHCWERSCYLASADVIPQHVSEIVLYSETAGIIGLLWDRWAVREFLPTRPLGICPRFGNMPVCREFRFFVEDDNILCWHAYWPMSALEQGGLNDPALFMAIHADELCRCDDETELRDLASKAGQAVGGAWSVDILETGRGWFITDMAEADKSFHWEGCPYGRPGND